MTDVELLREYAGFSGTPVDMRAVLFSSADRIEKLEAALRGVIAIADRDCPEFRFARKALEGEDDPKTDL